ncbi:MAG TPA: TonB-dependent receptor [Thermoanaerobaculia bacterium]|nr:TonB-dependent receptor [Thermoanaerobaculia bacterium]
MTLRRTWLILLLVLVAAGSAFAQSATTATMRGKITNAQGNPVANAEINAVETSSGFVHTVNSRSDGSYTLAGLTPGAYNIVVAATGYEPKSQDITVQVGQVLDVNIRMTPTAVLSESITVVGTQAVETKTHEAATNVTPQQIESLPQPERNFLNFAALAPGIRVSKNPERKTIAGDAQDSEQTNVFIDGVSTKNDVLLGGTVGQDSSRGNPFPQSAVQEFRVITQNYSAQYDHASSAIITAVTKTGGNQFNGQAFVYYQPKNWVAPPKINYQFNTLTNNPSYRRYQPGINAGGAIIKDRLHFFVSYEGDQQHATRSVNLGNANFANQFGQFTGNFPSPFRQNLGFGKLSWQPDRSMLFDVSGLYRKEHEVRDFGGTTSYQAANDIRNYVHSLSLRNQWTNNDSLNEAIVTYQKFGWNPTALNPDLIGLNYEGIIRLGGSSTNQKFDQRRIELRDNYNFAPITAAGSHSIQVGGNFDAMHYQVTKSLFGNPQFNFKTDKNIGATLDAPYQALFGAGNPTLTSNNNEYGVYGEDRWTVNQNLSVTLGLRWDYESHMLDENYVTPANVVAGLKGKTFMANGLTIQLPDSYFSTGSQRKPYKSEFQPRVGFAYDIKGDSKSVVFGGFGRYYDRLFLNATLDERYRIQYPVYRIEFSQPGFPRTGAVLWDPKYLSVAGLQALVASGATSPEIFLLNNNTRPPYSNQADLGYRQTFGTWIGSASYNFVRGYRGMTWLSATGICCSALVSGFGNVLISDPQGKQFRYNGLQVSVDRPYFGRFGAHFAYTHGDAKQTGNDLFSLDMPSAAAYGFHAVPGSEKDRVVATGIFGIPWDVRFSTIVSLGSGAAFNVLDFSQGFSLPARQITRPFLRSIYPKKTWGFADRDVDFRLEKSFPTFGRTSIGVVAELFNAFNWSSPGCLANFIPPEGNPSLGKANCQINLGRREQVGLKVNF